MPQGAPADGRLSLMGCRARPLIFLFVLAFVDARHCFAGPISEHCRSFSKDSHTQLACQQLVDNYDLSSLVVRNCTKFTDDNELNLRCLRTGADQESFDACFSLKMNPENTLSCLLHSPKKSVASACAGFASSEDGRADCIRYGRELSQMNGCKRLFATEAGRLDCLEDNLSSDEMKGCDRENSEDGRLHCLQLLVDARESEENPGDTPSRLPASVKTPKASK